MSDAADRVFAGSIPQMYEHHLVPLIFEPYATDIAARVSRISPRQVLEIAAGTGAVTRRLAQVLPADVEIVATDFNQPMLDRRRRSAPCGRSTIAPRTRWSCRSTIARSTP